MELENKRIGYLDSMRGFAMLLVVINHVLAFSFHIKEFTFISEFFCGILFLNLFFMISGYFCYKNKVINLKTIGRPLISKFFVLVVSAFIFMAAFCIYCGDNPLKEIKETMKMGYWYTFSLFEFIVLYYAITLLFRRLLKSFTIPFTIILFIIITPIIDYHLFHYYSFVYKAFGFFHLKYFISFLFGAYLHENQHQFNKIFSGRFSNISVTSLIVLFFLFLYLNSSSSEWFTNSVICYTIKWIFIFLSLILTFLIFQRVQILSDNTIVGKPLKKIGRHTLEVYFLHYYFVLMHLEDIGNFFSKNPSPLLEFVLAFSIAIVIVLASLILGKVLRLSPFIAKYMLGIKERRVFQENTKLT